MTDSARWCQICGTHGDHHTDRHDQMQRAQSEVRKPIGRNLDPGPCLPGACTYGTCARTWSDPYGCGGCCACLGGCQASAEDKVVRNQYKVSDRRTVRLVLERS